MRTFPSRQLMLASLSALTGCSLLSDFHYAADQESPDPPGEEPDAELDAGADAMPEAEVDGAGDEDVGMGEGGEPGEAGSDGGSCIEERADEQAGIFVSVSGASVLGCGTRQLPCKTVALGLARAAEQFKQRVFVSLGTYTERLQLQPGISVEGGWSEAANGWSRACRAEPDGVVIESPDNVGIWAEYEGKATLELLTVKSRTTPKPGESHYAIFARGMATRLTLRNVIARAAPGGNGADGADGGTLPTPLAPCAPDNGLAGATGAAAAPAPLGTYGTSGFAPADGAQGKTGTPGHAGTLAPPGTCGPCHSQGTAGDCLPACVPVKVPGSGQVNATCCLNQGDDGSLRVCAERGRSGCGGAPGTGGGGGKGGGASIGLFVADANVEVLGGVLSAAAGGTGGKPGAPGAGAAGSAGTAGETPPCSWCEEVITHVFQTETICEFRQRRFAAPAGGTGGRGGNGGEGGAGAGGDSFAYYLFGVANVDLSDDTQLEFAAPNASTSTSPVGAAGKVGPAPVAQ